MEAGCSMCLRIVLVLMRFVDQPQGAGGLGGGVAEGRGAAQATQQVLRLAHPGPLSKPLGFLV